MNFVLEKLNGINSKVGRLKRLCQSWQDVMAVQLALNNISLLLNDIHRVVLKQTKLDDPVSYFKQRLLAEELMFDPEWAIWNTDSSSIVFCQMINTSDSLRVGNYVKMTFQWLEPNGSLTLRCSSNVADLNLRFRLKPHELAEKVSAILKCCRESVVCVERRDLTKWSSSSLVVKVDADHVLEVDSSSVEILARFPEPKKELDSPSPDDGVMDNDETGKDDGNGHAFQNGVAPVAKSKRRSASKNARRKPQSKQYKNRKLVTSESKHSDPSRALKEEQTLGDGFKREPSEEQGDRQQLDTIDSPQAGGRYHLLFGERLPCRFCDRLIVARRCLVHLRKGHGLNKGDKAAECCFCPEKFDSMAKLRVHLKLCHFGHEDGSWKDELRACRLCGDLLGRKEVIVSHMKLKHDRPDECPFCEFRVGQTAKDVNDLCVASGSISPKEQLKRHHRFFHRQTCTKCQYCEEIFATRQLALEHRDNCQLRKDLLKKKIESEEKVVCNDCGQMVRKSRVNAHQDRVHKKNKVFVCPHCPKSYGKSGTLREHLVRNHYPEQKQHICGVCGKAFATKDALAHHSKMHEQPYIKCTRESCDKVFKWKAGVIQHLRGEL